MRLGLFGYKGRQGQRYLMPENGGARIVAVAGRGDRMDWEKVDGVIIATPAETHAWLATEALERGKHVLVEKPLAMSLMDCDAVLEVARKRAGGQVFEVAHTYRWGKVWTEFVSELRVRETRPVNRELWLDWGPHLWALAMRGRVFPSALLAIRRGNAESRGVWADETKLGERSQYSLAQTPMGHMLAEVFNPLWRNDGGESLRYLQRVYRALFNTLDEATERGEIEYAKGIG